MTYAQSCLDSTKELELVIFFFLMSQVLHRWIKWITKNKLGNVEKSITLLSLNAVQAAFSETVRLMRYPFKRK